MDLAAGYLSEKLGWFLACLCFSRSFAEEQLRSLSFQLGILKLVVEEYGVVALEGQHIFLGVVEQSTVVVGQLDSMESMVD
jgi:hypothetical protein